MASSLSRRSAVTRRVSLSPETMRDFFCHYAILAGILFFVGRLHVFPSLGDAFVAGLLATATAAVALLAFDAVLGHAATASGVVTSSDVAQPSVAEAPPSGPDA